MTDHMMAVVNMTLLYYSAAFEPLCVYCSVNQSVTSSRQCPQYQECQHLAATCKSKTVASYHIYSNRSLGVYIIYVKYF